MPLSWVNFSAILRPMSLIFDPQNPFPRVALENYDYSQAKVHSEEVDRWLGFEIEKVETIILANRQAESSPGRWHGLPAQTLLTPYIEIRLMLELCKPFPGQTVIDLGCAYARMAHVIHRHFLDLHFLGFEIEWERFQEAQRVLKNLKNPQLQVSQKNVAEMGEGIPNGDVYFIYDYGTQREIQGTIEQLKTIARQKRMTVIGRGRATRHQIQTFHPWLAEVNPPIHTQTFSIYRS